MVGGWPAGALRIPWRRGRSVGVKRQLRRTPQRRARMVIIVLDGERYISELACVM